MDYNILCMGCFANKGEQETCPFCGYEETETQASLFLIPRSILANKYIVGRVIGQGGFGITYLGWDLNLSIRIAIKEFFPQGLVSRAPGGNSVISYTGSIKDQFTFGVESFIREAKTLARFEQHPNIVTVRDFFKDNNTAYMVMTYIEGLTLLEHLNRAGDKIPVEQAVQIIILVIDALKEVHSAGIMHRDVSPDNIFIDHEGRVVLIDFGSARQKMREKSKSLSVILKAGYAPEEQYRSRGKQGPWTDIYAVAATFYRCITGQVVPDSIDRMIEDKLIPPSKLDVSIDPALETVLLKALAVKAENRYRDLEEMQAALIAAGVKEEKAEVVSDNRSSEQNEENQEEQVETDSDNNNQGEPIPDPEEPEAEDLELAYYESYDEDYSDETALTPEYMETPVAEPADKTIQNNLLKIYKYALVVNLSSGVIIFIIALFRIVGHENGALLPRLLSITNIASQNLFGAFKNNINPVLPILLEKIIERVNIITTML
jgi:serine/threonine protein kinase